MGKTMVFLYTFFSIISHFLFDVAENPLICLITVTHIGTGFYESPGTCYVISQTSFMQWSHMINGDDICTVTLVIWRKNKKNNVFSFKNANILIWPLFNNFCSISVCAYICEPVREES